MVATGPKTEDKAAAGLGLRRVTTFLPTYTRVARQHGRLRFAERKLFPGYLLIAFVPGDERWREVDEAPGVRHVLRWKDGTPQRVPATNVGDVMSGCAMGLFDADRARLGTRVKFSTVKKGPLISLVERYGSILSLAPQERVRVLFHDYGPLKVETMTLDELELAE